MATTKEYMIQKGDNLTNIAKTHGVTVDQLVKENNIKNPNLIYAGSTLKIPTTPTISVSNGGVGVGSSGSGSSGGNSGSSEFTPSDATKGKGELKDDLLNQYLNYGDISVDDTTLDGIIQKILNREDFSYDLNGDALYQQYKDKYIQQGKMAMQDTMGQAAAMTGGYGNSYAATVGNQAYQASLENLNDIVPELYQMAYDKYVQEGQDLYNQYGIASDDYSRRWNEELYKYNMLGDKVGVSSDDYWNSLGYENGEYWKNAEMDYAIGEANKGYARQDAYAMLQTGIMPSDAVLKAAGISTEDAQSIANAYKISAVQDNGGGGKVTVDDNGNLVVDNTPATGGITSDIKKKAESFESNNALAAYIDGLVWAGTITEAEGKQLYAQYVDDNEKMVKGEDGKDTTTYSYKDMVNSMQGWTVVSKGGGNLLGIDKNAKVKAPNGETMTLAQLRDKLESEGMKTSQANDVIKALQQNLGISSNWLFGW